MPRRLSDILAPDANSFGVVRLAMASAVLVSHSFWFVDGNSLREPFYASTGRSLGEYAVQVFFFLSGVLVTQSALRSRGLVDFARARVLRIFPGLIVCVVLTALVLGPAVSSLSPASYFTKTELGAYLAKTLLLVTGAAGLPGVFVDLPLAGKVNVSLWTLKYEVLCYAGLALLAFTLLRRQRWSRQATAALALLVLACGVAEPKPSDAFTTLDNIRYFIVFFGAGSLAYLLRDRLLLSEPLLLPLFGLFLVSVGTWLSTLGSAVFLGYATLCFASWRLGWLQGLCNEQDYSFGVYIYAGPVQQTLIWAGVGVSPLILTCIAFPLALTLAALSWNLVEAPALRWRHRTGKDGQTAEAAFIPRRPARLLR